MIHTTTIYQVLIAALVCLSAGFGFLLYDAKREYHELFDRIFVKPRPDTLAVFEPEKEKRRVTVTMLPNHMKQFDKLVIKIPGRPDRAILLRDPRAPRPRKKPRHDENGRIC